jgi:ankyrin repeat protein
MITKLNQSEIDELEKAFEDLLNYESDDPTDKIDPIKYREPGGDTCLHIAAYRDDCRSVELLLKSGIDVNDQGEMGCTALHYAKMKGNDKVVQLLLAHGASNKIKNEFGELP